MAEAAPPIVLGEAVVQAIYAVVTATSAYLAYVVWQHREKTGAQPMFVAILGGMWWSAIQFLTVTIQSHAVSVLLMKLMYVGVVVAVAAIFLFALEYTGRGHLVNRRTIALLSIEPIVVIALALFNPENVFFELSESAVRANGIGIEFGIGFLLHTLYSYGLVFASSGLIVGLIYRTRALYRGQLMVLVGAVLLPLIPNALAIAQVLNFDATPIGFFVADVLYTVAITRYRLIDLAPIARDRVVNNVNDGVFVIDTEHRIVDVNPSAEEMGETFLGEIDLIGEDARELLEFIPELHDIYEEILSTQAEQTVEYELGGRYYRADTTPIEDTRDRTVGWLFMIRDITEHKRHEQQLRERNEQLDKFASVVSHDLRNPLQVASGRVEIARETGKTDHLGDAEDALDRMETIIDDVLTLARSGDDLTNLGPVALEDAAEAAWETVETDGAVLDVETSARVTADRDRLIRLLENLFRNAVEHGMPEETGAASVATGGAGDVGAGMSVGQEGDGDPATGEATAVATGAEPHLTVAVDAIRQNGRPVGFYVADDGPGIPPDDRDAVFESGYSTNTNGTGFGLTIVSQIAEAHGWEVRAAAGDDGGARFEFTGAEVVND